MKAQRREGAVHVKSDFCNVIAMSPRFWHKTRHILGVGVTILFYNGAN